ncbi:hypothetical protein XELAEV_18020238mg [Xenopus laevis]|uniref:Uncharacterized protein n=1 Tax=Xenopus laevis TaxID=8355 RepID=A0A974HQU1_XENLA|nr:hypothetical protein XELAEV_18020238mg [Xenopus laevis]
MPLLRRSFSAEPSGSCLCVAKLLATSLSFLKANCWEWRFTSLTSLVSSAMQEEKLVVLLIRIHDKQLL